MIKSLFFNIQLEQYKDTEQMGKYRDTVLHIKSTDLNSKNRLIGPKAGQFILGEYSKVQFGDGHIFNARIIQPYYHTCDDESLAVEITSFHDISYT